jgi:hypothetical protein
VSSLGGEKLGSKKLIPEKLPAGSRQKGGANYGMGIHNSSGVSCTHRDYLATTHLGRSNERSLPAHSQQGAGKSYR